MYAYMHAYIYIASITQSLGIASKLHEMGDEVKKCRIHGWCIAQADSFLAAQKASKAGTALVSGERGGGK